MSKERLEDKLVKFRQHLALGYVKMDILYQAHEIHELVIEQAERVQELEDIIYQDERQAVLEGMYEQNKRYQEALEFYAKGNHYYAEGYPNTTLKATDYGEVARKALEE